ncbi:Kiwa anti-phage protein KwaB-like domain-containing protein [Ktedonobacter robiniae]|uniref:DUF4365 domain-containing protein n=1 Tax=Ktedonobacter robiniae TaxID=2778365 RepID=A0ABQ3UTU5_9CHLR|nr:Kiwa anti-phage protein KwaB-like domain-containing protein [Ktedonobacter robiniae]GHO56070.1 hypothetical protein KSB_45450 [Ktedonobacter robiniae]
MTVARAKYFRALQDILSLDISTCTAEVCIAARKDSESLPEFRRLRLAESIKKEFRDLVADCLVEYQKQLHLHNLQVLDFDVAGKPEKYQVEHIELTKPPYDHIVEQNQPLNMLHGLETFKEEPSFTEKMRFYVVILQPPQGQPIYFYRRYSPKRVLHASAPIAIKRILGNTDEFEDVKTPIFLFDKAIDCIGCNTSLFVLAKSHFYYMFQILNELIESAKETLDLIQQRIPIENFSQFARACINDKSKMQKLTSIARRPYLSNLTIAEMKPAIKRHQLHIPIIDINNGQQEMLHYDEDYPWDILKLLDDDYLTSIMTGQNYEVDAKRDP